MKSAGPKSKRNNEIDQEVFKYPPGVDFINICTRLLVLEAFFGTQRLANSKQIWQTAHRFGKFCKHFSLKFLVSVVGEIE